MPLSIGIIGFQGDVSEHAELLKKAANKLGIEVEVKEVRNLAQLSSIEAIIIPGGESTTMYKLLRLYSMYDRIRDMARNGLPVMGTCAGLILISSKTNDERVQGMRFLLSTMLHCSRYSAIFFPPPFALTSATRVCDSVNPLDSPRTLMPASWSPAASVLAFFIICFA